MANKNNPIYKYRNQLKLTQKQLAQLVGVPQQNVARLESGERSIEKLSAIMLYRYAKAFGVSMETLIQKEG